MKNLFWLFVLILTSCTSGKKGANCDITKYLSNTRKTEVVTKLISCSQDSGKIIDENTSYIPSEQRINVFKCLYKPPTEIDDVEFDLFNVNGFSNHRTTVPGASSWQYRFVIKVNPTNIDKWLDGVVKMDIDYNAGWMKNLIHCRKEKWRIKSTPEIYVHEESRTAIIVYREEGILFKTSVKQ